MDIREVVRYLKIEMLMQRTKSLCYRYSDDTVGAELCSDVADAIEIALQIIDRDDDEVRQIDIVRGLDRLRGMDRDQVIVVKTPNGTASTRLIGSEIYVGSCGEIVIDGE